VERQPDAAPARHGQQVQHGELEQREAPHRHVDPPKLPASPLKAMRRKGKLH
jgi:hypothetical protein